jgi:hypothetical protein
MRDFISVLFISTLLFGCAKVDHTHEDGTTGTNSVAIEWSLNDIGDGYGFYYGSFNVPSITSSVVNNGAVLVYMSKSEWTNPEWVALPYTQVYGEDWISTVYYSFYEGSVNVLWVDSDYLTPDYPSFDTFRVVVFEDRSLITDESILELIKKYEENKVEL